MAFKPIKRYSGAEGIATTAFPLAASQTIKKGAALTPSNGKLVAASNSTATKILIAAESMTTAAGESKDIQVYIPSDIVFEVPYKGTTKTAPVAADLFTSMDLDADGVSIQLDAQASPVGQVTVVGMDVAQRVLFVTINYPNIVTVNLPAATATVKGIVKASANQADSVAEDTAGLLVDFNALLAKLKTAGIMLPDA